MQLAHPLVAAGVAEHSTFRDGPAANVKRLHSTVRAMLDLSFGSPEDIRRAVGHINAIHDRVHGTLREAAGRFAAGTPYSAGDPELLIWVDATVRDSMLLAYELFVTPLSAADRDQFWTEGDDITTALRVPAGARIQSPDQFRGYLADLEANGSLAITTEARKLAREIRVACRHARAVALATLAPCHQRRPVARRPSRGLRLCMDRRRRPRPPAMGWPHQGRQARHAGRGRALAPGTGILIVRLPGRNGGTGRRAGLKIRFAVRRVWVRPPLPAPSLTSFGLMPEERLRHAAQRCRAAPAGSPPGEHPRHFVRSDAGRAAQARGATLRAAPAGSPPGQPPRHFVRSDAGRAAQARRPQYASRCARGLAPAPLRPA